MNRVTEKLPFDILCIVFNYYAEFDSPAEPLETILLVCKSWYNVALDHTKLWSRFSMNPNDKDCTLYFSACVARRLSRCPPNSLLNIHIHLEILEDAAHVEACRKLLGQLTGESGEVARRWRCVHMSTGRQAYYQGSFLTEYLRYSTPHLQEFKYAGLGGGYAILPDTSSLKIFHAVGLQAPHFPDLSQITDLEINVTWPTRIDERALALAVNVERMKLRSWGPFKLTATYTRLRTFWIEGATSEHCLEAFCAPNLIELILGPDGMYGCLQIGSCKGITFSNIQKASIKQKKRHHPLSIDMARKCCDAMRPLLMSMTGLEVLDLGGDFYPILLKVLTNDLQSLYQSHPFTLKLDGATVELGGKEISSINKSREEIGCT